jgi:hypothetical protein
MAKWIWKLYARGQSLCAEIIMNKYLRSKDMLAESEGLGSQFQNSNLKVKNLFCLGETQLDQMLDKVMGGLVAGVYTPQGQILSSVCHVYLHRP